MNKKRKKERKKFPIFRGIFDGQNTRVPYREVSQGFSYREVTFIWRFLLFTVCITSLKQADLISDPIMHLQLLHPSLSVI